MAGGQVAGDSWGPGGLLHFSLVVFFACWNFWFCCIFIFCICLLFLLCAFLLFVVLCAFVCTCICTSTHLQFRKKKEESFYKMFCFLFCLFLNKKNIKSCDFAFVFCFCLLLFVLPCAFVCTGICTSTHLHFAKLTKNRIIIFWIFY